MRALLLALAVVVSAPPALALHTVLACPPPTSGVSAASGTLAPGAGASHRAVAPHGQFVAFATGAVYIGPTWHFTTVDGQFLGATNVFANVFPMAGRHEVCLTVENRSADPVSWAFAAV